MPRRSSTMIPDADSPFSHGKLKENTVYGKAGESIGEIMARMANAPIRETVIEMDAVSPYPVTHRRSSFVPETPKKVRRNSVNHSTVKRTDNWLCAMLQPHTHDLPWLTNPEDYRCVECGRYCSDTFLVNKICGYCRGEY